MENTLALAVIVTEHLPKLKWKRMHHRLLKLSVQIKIHARAGITHFNFYSGRFIVRDTVIADNARKNDLFFFSGDFVKVSVKRDLMFALLIQIIYDINFRIFFIFSF